MNDLATRKRVLLAQADLHRQLIALECVQIGGRVTAARSLVSRNRWWLVGGAVVSGLLLRRPAAGGLISWVPAVLGILRTFRS